MNKNTVVWAIVGFVVAIFFYLANFGFFTQQILLFVDEPQKLSLRSLQTP